MRINEASDSVFKWVNLDIDDPVLTKTSFKTARQAELFLLLRIESGEISPAVANKSVLMEFCTIPRGEVKLCEACKTAFVVKNNMGARFCSKRCLSREATRRKREREASGT